MERLILTAAHAFIPGQMTMAHAAGTYIPADILYRLSLLFSAKQVRFTTGVDVHGTSAAKYLRTTGNQTEATTQYIDKFKSDLDALSIYPSTLVRTDDSALLPIIEFGLRNLQMAGLLTKKSASALYCASCGEFRSKSEAGVYNRGEFQSLKKNVAHSMSKQGVVYCLQCKSPIEVCTSEQWFLQLPRDEALRCLLERQPIKIARRHMIGIYKHDFHEWQFTRDNYFGISMPLDTTRQLYLWCEALFAKLMYLGPPEELPALLSDTSFICFLGKNIIPYYALVFPVILRYGFGVYPNILLSVRGFCRLEQSKDLLSLNDALSHYSSDELRFCCAYTVSDDMEDFSLSRLQFDLAIKSILTNTFEKYLGRAAHILMHAGTAWEGRKIVEVQEREKHYIQLSGNGLVRKLLLDLEQWVKMELRKLPTHIGSWEQARHVCHVFVSTYNILSCYIPKRIQKFRIYDSDQHGFLMPSRIRVPE